MSFGSERSGKSRRMKGTRKGDENITPSSQQMRMGNGRDKKDKEPGRVRQGGKKRCEEVDGEKLLAQRDGAEITAQPECRVRRQRRARFGRFNTHWTDFQQTHRRCFQVYV